MAQHVADGTETQTPRPVVLVVEDDRDTRDLLQLALEMEGYEVVTAVDGKEALSRVDEAPPDVILLDLGLPGVDGWEVIRTLKARRDDIADVPVLMVTADSNPSNRVRGALAGACRYMTKPFDPAVISRAVSAALASSQQNG